MTWLAISRAAHQEGFTDPILNGLRIFYVLKHTFDITLYTIKMISFDVL